MYGMENGPKSEMGKNGKPNGKEGSAGQGHKMAQKWIFEGVFRFFRRYVAWEKVHVARDNRGSLISVLFALWVLGNAAWTIPDTPYPLSEDGEGAIFYLISFLGG